MDMQQKLNMASSRTLRKLAQSLERMDNFEALKRPAVSHVGKEIFEDQMQGDQRKQATEQNRIRLLMWVINHCDIRF
jgi:hypothetical protein